MPERLRRTIRGLEKMIEPLRYHFDDLDKQVRRRPVGIDMISTIEILHKNLARIEQELALMRERVDMELLLRNDSLSDENLPLPGDTPPTEEDAPISKRDAAGEVLGPNPAQTRAFSATGNPFEIPPSADERATRADDRSIDETLSLKPVKLGKQASNDENKLPLSIPNAKRTSPDNRPVDNPPPRNRRSTDTLQRSNPEASKTKRDRSKDDTLVLDLRESSK